MIDWIWIRGNFLFYTIMLLIVVGDLSSSAETLILTNGDSITGRLLSQDSERVVIESEILGRLEIANRNVQSVQADPNQSQEKLAEEAKPKAEKKEPAADPEISVPPTDIMAEEAKNKFKLGGQFELGLNGRTGNTKRLGYDSNIKVTLTNPKWNLSGYFKSRYAEQEVKGETTRTDNELRGGGRIQRVLYNGISGYVALDLEKDEFEQLRLRSIVNSGLGILWIKSEEWFYENRVGMGCRHERFEEGETRESTIGNLTSELRYKVNSHIDIAQETSWVVDIQDSDEYSLLAETAATIYLNNDHSLFLKSGLKHEYENKPANRNVERLDTYYFSNLGYKF